MRHPSGALTTFSTSLEATSDGTARVVGTGPGGRIVSEDLTAILSLFAIPKSEWVEG